MSGIEQSNLAIETDWHEQALCAEVDSDIFFADADTAGAKLAKQVCALCPVLEPCLADVIATPEPFGIRAGKTPKQVSRLRNELGRQTVHQEALEARRSEAQRFRDDGLSLQQIAQRLGYASHGAVASLLGYRVPEHGEAS